jgi:exodeoxyribonuclease VII small subunit
MGARRAKFYTNRTAGTWVLVDQCFDIGLFLQLFVRRRQVPRLGVCVAPAIHHSRCLDLMANQPGNTAPLPGAGSASSTAAGLDSGTPGQPAAPSFEAALAELEAIVARMESGELPLEQSLAAYKRGAQLLQFCQTALQDAQQQVQILEAGLLQDFSSGDTDE